MASKSKNKADAKQGGLRLRMLDARPDRLDFRDLLYRAPLRSLPPRFPDDADIKRFIPAYLKAGLLLNQGLEGACTGFGLACVANYLMWRRHVESGGKGKFEGVSARMFYELAKRYDEWPGTDYDGSSCRGALKGWHKHGACADRLWPYPLDANNKPIFQRPSEGWAEDAVTRPLGVYYRINRLSIVDMQAAICEIGAVYCSGSAHDGWDNCGRRESVASHAELPIIPPEVDKSKAGNHAFALVGYNEHGFIVQNSWGANFGASGFAVLPYADWIANSTDAWAVALGVTLAAAQGLAGRAAASSFPVGRALGALQPVNSEHGSPADDPWPVDHPFKHHAYRPWPSERAYRHSLVMGGEGLLVVSDLTRDMTDREGHAAELLSEAPLRWWKAARKPKTLKLAVYALGGLYGEAEAIRRIRVLAPCFEANGIYPVFIAWKNGIGEALSQVAEDWRRRTAGEGREGTLMASQGEARDRALEVAARTLARGIWSEMRENAAAASAPGHVLDLLVSRLTELQARLGQAGASLELHWIAHSAGSILLGHGLTRISDSGAPLRLSSCNLFAPACSMAFANKHWLAADAAGVLSLDRLHLHLLSDANEQADGLPSAAEPVYGKSLLYLVSRALEDERRQALLGLAAAHDARHWDGAGADEVARWAKAFGRRTASHTHVIGSTKVRTTKALDQTSAGHASFDRNLDLLSQTLQYIKGGRLAAELEWLDF